MRHRSPQVLCTSHFLYASKTQDETIATLQQAREIPHICRKQKKNRPIMTKFRNLEIAPTVANHPNISIKTSMFGLRTKIYYKPTSTEIDCIRNYYTISSGNAIHQFLLKFQHNPQCAEEAKLPLEQDDNGNYCLEVCSARDGQFIALQLFRYNNLMYNSVCEIKVFEGQEASMLKKALAC